MERTFTATNEHGDTILLSALCLEHAAVIALDYLLDKHSWLIEEVTPH